MKIKCDATNVCMQACSITYLFATLWTVPCQAPLSMGFSKQEYWSGLPCPPPGDLPDSGLKPVSPASPYIGRQILYSWATGIVGTKYKSIFLSPLRWESLRCIFLLKDGASRNGREPVIDETWSQRNRTGGISGRWKDQLWNEGRTIHRVRKETRKCGRI